MTTAASGGAPKGIRARDADRQLVIDGLSEAHASGQLSFDEFDERSRAASAARTLEQLAALIADLQTPPALPRPLATSPAVMTAGEPAGHWRPPSPRRRLVSIGIAAAIVVGVVGAAMGVIAAVGSGSSVLGGNADIDIQTAAGYDAFVAEFQHKFGSTEVVEAVIYPGYAVVSVPVAGHRTHVESYYYDGEFDQPTPDGTRASDDPTVKLSAIDGDVLAQVMDQAPKALGIAQPQTRYVIVKAWGDPPQPSMQVYAGDGFDTAYLVAAADGHLLDAYPAGG